MISELITRKSPNYTILSGAKNKRLLEKIYAGVNLPCKKFDGEIKKVYNINVHKKKIYPRETLIYTIAVTLAVRSHLFSYRTQKLSSLAPKILCWRRHGKIGCCCIQKESIHLMMSAFSFCATTVSLTANRKRLGFRHGKKSQFIPCLIYINNPFCALLLTGNNLL